MQSSKTLPCTETKKGGPEVHLVDGTVIRARRSDREAYTVSDKKKRYGYLVVLVLSSDGFPEAVGIYRAPIGGKSKGRRKRERRKRKYEALADFLMNRTHTTKKAPRKLDDDVSKGKQSKMFL